MLRILFCAVSAVCVLGLGAQAEARDGTLTPGPLSAATAMYSNGAPVLVSQKSKSQVAIGASSATIDRSDRLSLVLLVSNIGDAPVAVGPDNMRVSTDAGESLRVFSADDLEREARRREDARRQSDLANSYSAMQSAAGALSSAEANSSNIGSSGLGATGGNSGNGSNFSNATPQMRAAADQQAVALNDLAEAQSFSGAPRVNGGLAAFQEQMVLPGGSYSARVTIARLPRNTRSVVIELDVGDELHRLDFAYADVE